MRHQYTALQTVVCKQVVDPCYCCFQFDMVRMETAVLPLKLAPRDRAVGKDPMHRAKRGNVMEGLQLRVEMASSKMVAVSVDEIGVLEAQMLLGMLVSMRAQLAASLPKRMCSSQISTFTEK